MSRLEKNAEIATGTPLSSDEVMQSLCKSTGKFGLMLAFASSDLIGNVADKKWGRDQISKATNGRLSFDTNMDTDILIEGRAFFLFDTESECYEAFDDIVGDDGPTKRNSYDGEFRVYALVFSNEGEIWSENT